VALGRLGAIRRRESGTRGCSRYSKAKRWTTEDRLSLESNEWTFRLDPVFQHGLVAVQQVAEELANNPFESAPPETFDWPRFFRIQMAYLLLWSAVERFSSFAYGPSLDPGGKVRAFGKDPRFLAAFERQVRPPTQEVSDSRDPAERTRLDRSRPDEAAAFYYQVRSNLSHRGKGAWSDGEIVRQSLRELLAILFSTICFMRLNFTT
jgi:hypothetical protein